MRPYLTHFGNPSSSHAYGRPSKAAVKYGRDRVAKLMGCSSSEVFFTSCGSEADNWAIASALARGKQLASCTGRPHVVTSNIEHPAILEALRAYQADGLCDFTLVEVDGEGTVCPSAVERAVTENTVLVTIMHSNNEVGAVQDLAAIAKAAKRAKRDVLVHTDAAQSFGKVCVNVKELGVDLCTLVGHKLGAPKGIGALFIDESVTAFPNFLHGGGQEGGRRAGTENVLLISGLGKACEIASRDGPRISSWMKSRRDQLRDRILAGLDPVPVLINGQGDGRGLPNTLSISIAQCNASEVLAELSEDVAASAGAACHSGGAGVSSVLTAIGLDESHARGTLRLSTGRLTTEREVDRAAELLCASILQSIDTSL